MERRPLAESARPELDRFPALDGVRGIAILLVVAFHASYPGFWRSRLDLPDLFRIGWIGVDLFFVLSGFLITRILINTLDRPRYFSSFYVRRALRIFPLYYAFLGLFLIALTLHFSLLTANPARAESQIILSSLYIQDYVIPLDIRHFYTPLQPTWSLAVEEQFYLLWPLLLWWVGRHRALALCLCGVAAAVLVRWLLLADGFTPLEVYMYAPSRFDALLGGAILAILVARYGAPPVAVVDTALVAGATAVAAAILWGHGDLSFESVPMVRLGYLGFGLLFFGLVAKVLHRDRRLAAAFEPSLLRRIGRYSYCIYLVHWPILKLSDVWDLSGIANRNLPSGASYLVFFAFVAGTSFTIAHFSSRYFEIPIQRLKVRFPY